MYFEDLGEHFQLNLRSQLQNSPEGIAQNGEKGNPLLLSTEPSMQPTIRLHDRAVERIDAEPAHQPRKQSPWEETIPNLGSRSVIFFCGIWPIISNNSLFSGDVWTVHVPGPSAIIWNFPQSHRHSVKI